MHDPSLPATIPHPRDDDKMAAPGMAPDRIMFRPETTEDAALVARAHAGHWRAPPDFALPAPMLATLLAQQHAMQERHIAGLHPGAERRMILADGVAVGRLCLDRTTLPWHIVDVAVVAEATGQGIGRAVLDALKDEAAAANAPLVLEVAHDNIRAQALYHRVGFIPAGGDSATHRRMAWRTQDDRADAPGR
jgi:ribosomal protein S18 acetylase RimI-like enzyme